MGSSQQLCVAGASPVNASCFRTPGVLCEPLAARVEACGLRPACLAQPSCAVLLLQNMRSALGITVGDLRLSSSQHHCRRDNLANTAVLKRVDRSPKILLRKWPA